VCAGIATRCATVVVRMPVTEPVGRGPLRAHSDQGCDRNEQQEHDGLHFAARFSASAVSLAKTQVAYSSMRRLQVASRSALPRRGSGPQVMSDCTCGVQHAVERLLPAAASSGYGVILTQEPSFPESVSCRRSRCDGGTADDTSISVSARVEYIPAKK